MKKLLTPRSDFVFKKLFTADTEILVSLINACLNLPEEKHIRSVTVKNPILEGEKEIRQKFIVLDVLAEDESGNRYDIEMQVRRYSFYPKRMLFYLCRTYSGQLVKGKDYDILNPVTGIHFLDYEMFPEHEDFAFCFELRDVRYPELILTDDFSLYLFELPKSEKRVKKPETVRTGGSLPEWLYFFNHADEEGERAMRTHYRDPAIHRAFTMLETLSADEETRRLAEIREESLRNEMYELDAARKEGERRGEKRGERRGKTETAENLLVMGILSAEQIVQATGLGIEEIKELEKHISPEQKTNK